MALQNNKDALLSAEEAKDKKGLGREPRAEKKAKKRKNAVVDRPISERKKRGSPLKGAAFTFLFFVLLLGAALSAFYFNWFDARGLTAEWLGVDNEVSARKEERLAQWETDLQRDAQKLAEDQKNAEDLVAQTAELEAAVKKQENEIREKMKIYEEMSAQLQSKNNDNTNVAKMIEGMSAEAAAAMLSEMKSMEAMVKTFSHLKPAAQAAILEALDAKTAATLVDTLSG